MGQARARGAVWVLAGGVAIVQGLAGCEAVLGVGSLSETADEGGQDGDAHESRDSSADAKKVDGGKNDAAGLEEASHKDSGADGAAKGEGGKKDASEDQGGEEGEEDADVDVDGPVTVPEMDATMTVDAARDVAAVDAPVDARAVDSAADAAADACPGLGNSSNCGVCGHSCEGGQCVSGVCQPVSLIPATNPVGLAVNESTIYWELEAGNVMSASVAGTPVTPPFYSNTNELGPNLVINSTNVYWTEDDGNGDGPYVQSLLFNGNGSWQFDVSGGAVYAFPYIAVDGTNLYVERNDIAVQGGGCPGIEIDVSPLNHDAMTSVIGGCSVVQMVVDSSKNLFWTDSGSGNGFDAPSVMMEPVSNATTTTQIAPAVSPVGIAVYGGKLYWNDSFTGEVTQFSIGGTGSPTMLSSSTAPGSMVADASGVYWIDSGTSILKVPLSGGTAQTIAKGQTAIAIATNSTSVFWINQGASGAVMKLAK